MKIKIILCHPSATSLCASIAAAVQEALGQDHHEVELENLYDSGFDPVLSSEDLEMVSRGQVAPQVAAYQDQLAELDAVVFVYPVWWFDRPAMLKGWFDRVFSRGYAYDYAPDGPRGQLSHLKSFVVQVAGGPEQNYVQSNMLSVIQNDIAIGTLGFCAISPVEVHTVFGSVARTRADLSEEIKTIQSKVLNFLKCGDL